ncbi:alpha/beta hydrolase [Candidatus Saccharibacteria bacterium]|nr:alpha/beta hydrolase [Candidatus Saccharibacteria bacterium]
MSSKEQVAVSQNYPEWEHGNDYNPAYRRETLALTRILHSYEGKFARTRRFTAIGAIGLSMSLGIGAGQIIERDYVPQTQLLENTHPEILSIYDAYDEKNRDTVSIGFAGFGVGSAENMMQHLEVLRDISSVAAMEYDQAGIDYGVMAEEFVEYAAERGIENVVVIGHSIGGLISTQFIAKLKEMAQNDPKVPKVIKNIMMQSPEGVDSVRSGAKEFGGAVCRLLASVPALARLKTARFTGEMIARYDQYTGYDLDFDLQGFVGAAEEVYDDKIRGSSVSTNILRDQFCGALGSGAAQPIRDIKSFDENGSFSGIYLQPENPMLDTVVDETIAYRDMKAIYDANGFILTRCEVANIGHDSPGQRPDEFAETFRDCVLPEFERDGRKGHDTKDMSLVKIRPDTQQVDASLVPLAAGK